MFQIVYVKCAEVNNRWFFTQQFFHFRILCFLWIWKREPETGIQNYHSFLINWISKLIYSNLLNVRKSLLQFFSKSLSFEDSQQFYTIAIAHWGGYAVHNPDRSLINIQLSPKNSSEPPKYNAILFKSEIQILCIFKIRECTRPAPRTRIGTLILHSHSDGSMRFMQQIWSI